jgi:hypothetical protein
MLPECCRSLIGRHQLAKIIGKSRQSKCSITFFCSLDTVYKDNVQYLIMCIVIRNQYITFCYKVLFKFIPLSLNTGWWQSNSVVIIGFSNVKTTRMTLNFNKKLFFFSRPGILFSHLFQSFSNFHLSSVLHAKTCTHIYSLLCVPRATHIAHCLISSP